jgi:hypothetical protein
MIFAQTAKEAAGYTNRYASALYNLGGGGNPSRSGLVKGQYYPGRILENGRFHVLKPDRMCCLNEFLSFQLVSKQWAELTEAQRSLLMAVYSQKKLALSNVLPEVPGVVWYEIAAGLEKAGYLRWTDEIEVVELTLVGEAEIEHHIFNRGTGSELVVQSKGGIRIEHHSVQEHEIDLGRASTLTVNVDGMCIRIITLPGSGAVVRIDHDELHRVYMSHVDKDKRFAQAYVDRITPFQSFVD